MKKIILCLIALVGLFGFCGCDKVLNEVVRIHIRANSNSEEDQGIKLIVRDEVVTYITPMLANCNNSREVKSVLSKNIKDIESIANNVLSKNGFQYKSRAEIRNEYFPSRDYAGEIFPADYYDALIVELGSGTGNNWWCVAYPPLCFVGNENDSGTVKYKSKIYELIDKYFGGAR